MDNLHQLRLPAEERIPELVVCIPAVVEDSPVVAVEVYIPAAADTAAVAAVLLPAS